MRRMKLRLFRQLVSPQLVSRELGINQQNILLCCMQRGPQRGICNGKKWKSLSSSIGEQMNTCAFHVTHKVKERASSVSGRRQRHPPQCSCLGNPMDGGDWWAAIHRALKSRTWLRNFTFTFHFHALDKEMATHSSVLAWRIPGTGKSGGLQSMRSHRNQTRLKRLSSSSSSSVSINIDVSHKDFIRVYMYERV